ncbi:MAG: DUF975 family protein [Candidatus Coproplasma sp.]
MRAKDFRTRAWNSMDGKWGTLAVITLIVSLIEGVLGGLGVIGIGAIALLLVIGPITLSMAIISLKVIRGYNVEIGDTFLGFKNFTNAFLLMFVNEILIFLWSLLFIIPGIVKTYAYSMSHYILADNPDMDSNQARLRSIEMMNGNKWRLFCLDLSFIGWGILCILTFGILSFWVQPYKQCAYAAFYEEIKREQSIMNNGASSQPAADPVTEAAPADEVNEDTQSSKTVDDNGDNA